jgi:hypothetical protein
MADELLLSLSYSHSLRLTNQRVVINVFKSGACVRAVSSKNEPVAIKTLALDQTAMEGIKKQLNDLNWSVLEKDSVLGFDGTTVELQTAKNKISLWSPDYDTKQRGLTPFQALVLTVLGAAELAPDACYLAN